VPQSGVYPGYCPLCTHLIPSAPGQVLEPAFLEASTGRRYSPAACPYEGVEFVWNAANFWACMQVGCQARMQGHSWQAPPQPNVAPCLAPPPLAASVSGREPRSLPCHALPPPPARTLAQAPEPHSDSRAVPASLSWDLGDPTKWEAVLDPSQTRWLEERGRGACLCRCSATDRSPSMAKIYDVGDNDADCGPAFLHTNAPRMPRNLPSRTQRPSAAAEAAAAAALHAPGAADAGRFGIGRLVAQLSGVNPPGSGLRPRTPAPPTTASIRALAAVAAAGGGALPGIGGGEGGGGNGACALRGSSREAAAMLGLGGAAGPPGTPGGVAHGPGTGGAGEGGGGSIRAGGVGSEYAR
jgi:hypothetical protein